VIDDGLVLYKCFEMVSASRDIASSFRTTSFGRESMIITIGTGQVNLNKQPAGSLVVTPFCVGCVQKSKHKRQEFRVHRESRVVGCWADPSFTIISRVRSQESGSQYHSQSQIMLSSTKIDNINK
jgi:hypothetical protein